MKDIDIENPKNCVVNLVKKIKRNMTRKNDQVMRKFNISSGHFSILTAIYNHKGLKASQLVHIFEMEKSTISRELKILENKKLIEFDKQSKGRGKAICITEKGKVTYEKAYQEWRKIQEKTIKCIGKDNYKALMDINAKLMDFDIS